MWLREREIADIENGEDGYIGVLIFAAVKCNDSFLATNRGDIACRLWSLHVDVATVDNHAHRC